MKFSTCLLSLLIIFIYACNHEQVVQSPLDSIKDKDVKSVLEQAMTTAGGLDNWSKKKSLQFKKYFALYDSTGATENAVNQQHHYSYSPTKEIKISWEKDSSSHKILSANGEITKKVNEEIDTSANQTSLKNTVLSATFVINIPFHLLDSGVELSYDGIDTLEDNKVVKVLKAVYNPEKHNNHSTPDIWWYYFDEGDARLVAYMVKHADHYSYVKNLTYIEKDGFLLCGKRQSFRVDPDRNILYLRADYEYTDYLFEM